MSEFTVRPAVATDCVAILRMLKLAYTETACVWPPVKDELALGWILGTLPLGKSWVLLEPGNRIVGSSAWKLSQFPWNDEFYMLVNSWFYVMPRARGKGTSMLLDALFASTEKAPLILELTTGVSPEIKDRLLRAHGFTYLGGSFARGFEKRPEGGAR